MSHVRKDTLVAPPEWWKHLRPFLKRLVSKKERRAAQKGIRQETMSKGFQDSYGNPYEK